MLKKENRLRGLVIGMVGVSVFCFIGQISTAIQEFYNPSHVSVESKVFYAGATDTQATISLNRLIEDLKVSDMAKYYANYPDQFQLKITSTENEIHIQLTSLQDHMVWNTTFVYQNGILSLVPSNKEENASSEVMWVSQVLASIAQLQNASLESLMDSTDGEIFKNATLETVGLEYQTRKYEKDHVSGDMVTSFKVDLIHGVRFDLLGINTPNSSGNGNNVTSSEPIQNPSTGDFNLYVVGSILVIVFGLSWLSVSKLKRSN